MDKSMIDVAVGGVLMNKTPEQVIELISNMAENSQQFGSRSVRPKNICRLLNRQPQLPHRALTEKHPDASSADGEDDPLHFSVTLQQEFCAMVRQIFIYTKEEVQKMDSSTLNPKNEDCPDMKENPFFTTDLLYKLVKECVAMLDHLFPSNNLSISAECDGQNGVPKPAQSGGRVSELEEIKYMQSLYMKSTVAELQSLKQIRSKSSTVKTD
ncbi:hypothetical protein ZIOFF_018764 [Zingiber officinale]|uniref:Uncharacterized protein n=1 Tax=Zingiber officinale TaxID=94328 RepID=A0A8J5LMD0_ZINOF|nr:hypothetical protein ZIOFF_018764 [Zingiber officinale]